jgi:glutamate dehydrogenase/leucine dehydrogenase
VGPYALDQEALRDVLLLSRGMTYKSAIANLDIGGDKSMIIGNPSTDKTSVDCVRWLTPEALHRFLELIVKGVRY